ncbi:hypothetical protein LCGC14_0845620 [marine sediment metagenome]|uniref:Uncharacterized protein n=1 Tax=marine sediment metagenome TaxID=412755 RepID=A0A0F9RWL8_9ZZZZ
MKACQCNATDEPGCAQEAGKESCECFCHLLHKVVGNLTMPLESMGRLMLKPFLDPMAGDHDAFIVTNEEPKVALANIVKPTGKARIKAAELGIEFDEQVIVDEG